MDSGMRAGTTWGCERGQRWDAGHGQAHWRDTAGTNGVVQADGPSWTDRQCRPGQVDETTRGLGQGTRHEGMVMGHHGAA